MILKKIQSILILAISATFLISCAKTEPIPTSTGSEASATLPQYCSDYPENTQLIKEPFHKIGQGGFEEWVGQATETGKVKTKKEPSMAEGETIDVVYFMMEQPKETERSDSNYYFYEYFKGSNEANNPDLKTPDPELGNDVNDVQFRIGTLENGTFSTTAFISDSTKKTIMDALNNATSIVLTFSVPRYLGRGAPSNFSFACIIE